jgi:hypothetical protein
MLTGGEVVGLHQVRSPAIFHKVFSAHCHTLPLNCVNVPQHLAVVKIELTKLTLSVYIPWSSNFFSTNLRVDSGISHFSFIAGIFNSSKLSNSSVYVLLHLSSSGNPGLWNDSS